MPSFVVNGTGMSSGRKRQRTYRARNESHAKELTHNDGTIVDSIQQLPEPLATEKQLAYAKALGITIPERGTVDELSDLISARVDGDSPANARHFSFADRYQIEYTQYTGKASIFLRIRKALEQPGREQELVAWFVFRVYRGIVRGQTNAPITGPDDPIIQDLASKLVQNEAVLKSIRRYGEDGFVWFGEWVGPDGAVHRGASKDTTAYKHTRDLLGQQADIRSSSGQKALNPRKDDRSVRKARAGCFTVIASLLLILALVVAIA